jgi:hypothetical protein
MNPAHRIVASTLAPAAPTIDAERLEQARSRVREILDRHLESPWAPTDPRVPQPAVTVIRRTAT